MIKTIKLPILSILFFIIYAHAYAQENDTISSNDHKSKINDFIKKLRKKTPTSMYDFFTFFGENNEFEIQYIRKHCEKDSISFNDCVELSKKLYSSPFKYKSLTFETIKESKLGKYIQKLHPQDSIQICQDTINILPAHYIINTKEELFYIKMNVLKNKGNFISDILDKEKKSIFTMK